MDRLRKELWVASFLKSLAFSKHCNKSMQSPAAAENICIKTGAEPFSKAIGFGHLPLSSSENPAPKVHSQEPTCTVTQTPNTIFLSAAACSSTRCPGRCCQAVTPRDAPLASRDNVMPTAATATAHNKHSKTGQTSQTKHALRLLFCLQLPSCQW